MRVSYPTGDPLHKRAACTQPCNVNTHSRAHCYPGARLCEQLGHGCVNNGARLCASARLCRGSPVDPGMHHGTCVTAISREAYEEGFQSLAPSQCREMIYGVYIDGLVQEYSISIANVLQILLSFNEPSIYYLFSEISSGQCLKF